MTKHCIKCINYFFVFLAKHSTSIWLTYEEMTKSNTAERKKIISQIHHRSYKQILVLKVLCLPWFFKFTIWYTSAIYLKEIFTFVPSFGFNILDTCPWICSFKYVFPYKPKSLEGNMCIGRKIKIFSSYSSKIGKKILKLYSGHGLEKHIFQEGDLRFSQKDKEPLVSIYQLRERALPSSKNGSLN